MKMLTAMFLGFVAIGATIGYIFVVGTPMSAGLGFGCATALGLGLTAVYITVLAREYGIDA